MPGLDVRKKMKIQRRNNFEGFERVSMFPYVWWRFLIYTSVVVAATVAALFVAPSEDPRMRIAICFGALFLSAISILIYQHRIAAFKCRRCGCTMEKYRDPDTSEVTLYYACDACRIYWENKAVSGYPV